MKVFALLVQEGFTLSVVELYRDFGTARNAALNIFDASREKTVGSPQEFFTKDSYKAQLRWRAHNNSTDYVTIIVEEHEIK